MSKTKIANEELFQLINNITSIYDIIKNEFKKTPNDIIVYNNKIYCLNKTRGRYEDYWSKDDLKLILNIDNLKVRANLKRNNKGLYLKVKNLDTILNLISKINFYDEMRRINPIRNSYLIEDLLGKWDLKKERDNYNAISRLNEEYYIDNIDKYQKLVNFIETINKENGLNKNINTIDLFDKNNNVFIKYKNKTLEKYDLSNINFDGKNISGIDISKNPEVKINFDKIVKDLTDSSINGYNLNKYTFRNYNLTNTDLRNTGATVDLASCIINKSGKMCSGTLFDEDNKFIFGDEILTNDDINRLRIKIYKKGIK